VALTGYGAFTFPHGAGQLPLTSPSNSLSLTLTNAALATGERAARIHANLSSPDLHPTIRLSGK
jgi:hypothetical protein